MISARCLKIMSGKMKILFIPAKYKRPLDNEFLEKVLDSVKNFKRIGLFTTVQFLDQMKQLEEFLKSKGKEVFIGESKFRASAKGQVLGCDPTAALSIKEEIEVFIYLGSGIFHPLAVSLESDKKIIVANPLSGEISEFREDYKWNYLKLKEKRVAQVLASKKIGILVSTKRGQYNLALALTLKGKLEFLGKDVYIFISDLIMPEDLINFPDIEAWINTACPRIAIDDIERFEKPVANANDILMALES